MLAGDEIKMLGRWAISYDSSNVKTKVHQANHDHCGVCDVAYLVPAPASSTPILKSRYMMVIQSKLRDRAAMKLSPPPVV